MSARAKRFLPFATYVICCGVLLASVLVLRPGWGFMDDFGLRGLAADFWTSGDKWETLLSVYGADVNNGRFRPAFYTWAIAFYGLFHNHALLFNLFVTLAGLLCLPVWGKALQIAYGDDDRRLLWMYGLSFFIFTPFWNIFMYLSLQERFFLVFGGLGFLSYLLAKRRNSLALALVAALCFALTILGKETGVSIFAAFCVYAVVDLLFLTRERRVNGWFLSGALVFGIPYVAFLLTRIVGRGYSEGYSAGQPSGGMFTKVAAMPMVVKGLVLLGLLALLFFLHDWFISRRRRFRDPQWVLFPLCLVAYLAVLIPWGYPTYMLSPAAIFLFGTLYAPIRFIGGGPRTAVFSVLAAASLLVILMNSVPAIAMMADKRELAAFAVERFSSKEARLAVPAPLEEASETLKILTGAAVSYHPSGVLAAGDLGNGQRGFLVVSDECGPFRLENLDVGPEVYRNGTWAIYPLHSSDGVRVVMPDFPKTWFKRLKQRVRAL